MQKVSRVEIVEISEPQVKALVEAGHIYLCKSCGEYHPSEESLFTQETIWKIVKELSEKGTMN